MTLPLSTFLYKDGDGRRYLGPMAQDFHGAFGLGTDDTRIAMNDIDGVSLASLKALDARCSRCNRSTPGSPTTTRASQRKRRPFATASLRCFGA